MENTNTDVSFKYTYSAKEQDEIKKIRQKYQLQEEDGMSRLRKLDAKVTQKVTSISLAVSMIGALVLGFGMSLVMTDLGSAMEINKIVCMVLGIAVGLAGVVMTALAYPVYHWMLKKEREKAAPEILKLTEELMK